MAVEPLETSVSNGTPLLGKRCWIARLFNVGGPAQIPSAGLRPQSGPSQSTAQVGLSPHARKMRRRRLGPLPLSKGDQPMRIVGDMRVSGGPLAPWIATG